MMKTILATTYAVNPFKGSEDGMGWNMLLQIAKYNQVIAITRENNQEAIDKYMYENPNDLYSRITFSYFDLPYWMRFWKKGGRGAMLYYWMWQKGIVSHIRKMKYEFDIAHNLNFHNDWTPSYLWKLNKPFIWGPVGHHPLIPAIYMQDSGISEKLKNRFTWFIKKFFWKYSRDLSKTISKADHVLCMNSSVVKAIPKIKEKSSILPSVATQDYGFNKSANRHQFKLISAGRLVSLKGFDLTIKSFKYFLDQIEADKKVNVTLTIVGSGPQQEYYISLISSLELEANVNLIEWIERDELLQKYQESSAFLFPSHEGAGMVVAEAMSFGLPVICLDNEGPGEFIDGNSGIAIKASNYQDTVVKLGNALYDLFTNREKAEELGIGARKRFLTHFNWESRGDILNQKYNSLLP